MRKLFPAILLFSLASCSTIPPIESRTVISQLPELTAEIPAKTSVSPAEKLIDDLVAAPDLHVQYVEDGAADETVLAVYPDSEGYAKNPIAREVKDIVALRDKALPLLIEHLDDTRPTSATVSQGGYLTDKPVRVPVGHICLDILINIVGTDNKLIYAAEDHGGFGSEMQDGYYFRPDDYRTDGQSWFEVRPIIRIVKSNWQKAYRDGKIKYDYQAPWK